jgi:cytochrome b561
MRTRYSAVAILFHWAIAALILSNLLLGWRMGYLTGMEQFEMFQLHKSIGITVLVLSVARLGWRLFNPPPPSVTPMKRWEHRVANSAHWFFYGMMIGMPVTGWAMVSVSPYNIPTLLWKTISWPHIRFLHAMDTAGKTQIEAVGGALHLYLALGGAALIALHVAAALKHHFIERDGVLSRMVPGLRSEPTT